MTWRLAPLVFFAALLAAFIGAAAARAQESDQALAKDLANPVASLITVPLQNNFDCCVGPENALRYTLNVQPVLPVTVSPDLTVVVRTILPVMDQGETTPGRGSQLGLGDVTQSFFFVPTPHDGLIWGAGPVFLWPTGSGGFGSGKWAAGPTVVVLEQQGPVTLGLLTNQLWSYAGRADHSPVSALFLQPFATYTWPDTTALSVNLESTYDWTHRQWTVPLDAGFSHLFKFGPQRVQLGLYSRIFFASTGGPQAGLRFTATFLFPKS